MKRTPSLLACGVLVAAWLPLSATAESEYYKTEINKATAQFKADKARCDALKGNDKDICVERAKANLKIAESDLQAYEKNTTAASLKAEHERVDQLYSVDKEKCDTYKGNAKDVCLAQASALKERREGNLKSLESRLKGDYQVAVEKCENLAGEQRSACKDEAKRKYKP